MENEDKLTGIQDKMNAMDTAKRKKLVLIFACVCVLIMILKLAVSLGNSHGKEEKKAVTEQRSEAMDEQRQVLEYSLERKRKSDEFEDYLDKLVEEDRTKEKEIKNGETE